MSTADSDKRTRAEVHLALGVSKEQPLFDAPTDEELAALIEDRLDATRRAQVFNVIANDPAVFNRWMAVVEMAETLNQGVFAAGSESPTRPRPSLLQRLASLLPAPVGIGGGLATAALIVFLVISPGGYDAQLDDLYRDYGSDWGEYPQTLGQVRASGDNVSLSAPDQALKQGVLEGLETLGERFALAGVSAPERPADLSSLSTAQVETLRALGQAATLSLFKCNLGAQRDYYARVLPLLQALMDALAAYSDDTSRALVAEWARDGSAESRVCHLSRQVISRIDDF